MKYVNIKICMVTMLLGVMMFSSGCASTMILDAGKTEDKVFGTKSFDDRSTPASRASVENQIGLPVESTRLAKLPSAEEFRMIENSFFEKRRQGEFAVAWVYYDRLRKIREQLAGDNNTDNAQNDGKQAAHEPAKSVYARYYYKGRIISSERISTNFHLAFGSWGLLEPVLIPAAALALTDKQQNYIDVWYDDYGLIVAYTWALAPYEAPPFASDPKQTR